MSILDKAKRLIGRGRPKLAQNAIEGSKIEHAILRDLRKRAPVLDDAISTPPESATPETWERLCEDVWSSYFGQNEPRVRGRDDIDPAYAVNREVVLRHVRSEEFESERPRTMTKATPSALGTVGALGSLRESYDNELSEHTERAKDIEEHQGELDDIDKYLESLREQRADADEGDLPSIDEKIRDAAESKRKSAAELKELQEAQALAAADMTKAVKEAVAKAVRAGGEAAAAAEMIPGAGIGKSAGADTTVNAASMFELAEKIRSNPELRKVLEMMGRLDLSMGSTRREMRSGGFEDIVDVEFGDDLQRVLTQEKMLIRHPLGKRDFQRRFMERSLIQYETIEQRELKRGPCIFVNDGSGSMGGIKNILCRGLTLSTVNVMHREHRNTAAIEFGSPGQARMEFFSKDRPLDPAQMIRFAEQFYGGGTSTLTGMRMALDLIRNEAPFHTADLIIVTDGLDYVTDEDRAIRDELRALGVKLHGIAIGIAPTSYMLEICDVATSVTDYTATGNQASNRLAIDLT